MKRIASSAVGASVFDTSRYMGICIYLYCLSALPGGIFFPILRLLLDQLLKRRLLCFLLLFTARQNSGFLFGRRHRMVSSISHLGFLYQTRLIKNLFELAHDFLNFLDKRAVLAFCKSKN